MIDAADFYKWMQIFQVNSGGGGGSVTMQDTYNASSPPEIDMSGAPVIFRHNSVYFTNVGDTTALQVNGNNLIFTNTVDATVGLPSMSQLFEGTTPNTENLTYATFKGGFSYEAVSGQESGFLTFGILDRNHINYMVAFVGATATQGSRIIFGGDLPPNSTVSHVSINVGIENLERPFGLFQIDSVTRGVLPFPRMNQTQLNTLYGLLNSGDTGMFVFNTTTNNLDYWNGSAEQQILTIDHLNAGTNISLDTTTIPGQVIVNASGGSAPTVQAQGSFSIDGNTTYTTFVDTSYVPLTVDPASFTVVNADNMTVFLYGGTSPAFQSNVSGLRNFDVVLSLAVKGSTVTSNQYTFTVFIKQSGGALIQTTYSMPINTGSGNPYENVSMSFSAPLDLNDIVYIQISDSAVFDPVTVTDMMGIITDTTIAGLANTDSLAQGSNNLYLSLDGGSNLQNTSGTIVNGNFPEFSGATGLIIDSGIPAVRGVNITDVSGAFYQMTDSAYENIYIVDSGTLTTLNLPVAISLGHSFKIIGVTGSWKVTQNTSSSQTIIANENGSFIQTIAGSAGYIESGISTDNCTLTARGSSTLYMTGAWSNGIQFNTAGGLVSVNTLGVTYSAGIYGMSISGNSASATTVATTQTSTNASYYLTFVASSTNGNQAAYLSTGLTFNPSTYVLSTTGLNLSGLTASSAVVTDSSKNLASVPLAVSITTVTGASQQMADTAYMNIYLLQNSASCTLTLPVSPTPGHGFKIIGAGSQTWSIEQNSGQFIICTYSSAVQSSTVGVGGSVSAITPSDCFEFYASTTSQFVSTGMNGTQLLFL